MPRGQHFKDPAFQRRMRSRVKHESLVKAGKAGYKALVEKKGQHFAARKAADWRRADYTRPGSGLERIVGGWLSELVPGFVLGDPRFCEVEVEGKDGRLYFADFAINKLAVEVHGAQWHEVCTLRPDQPERDRRKLDALAEAGFTVVILPEADVMSGAARETLIKLFSDGKELPF